MSLFFLVFFTLYGGLHAYALLRTRQAFSPSSMVVLGLALFMLLMVVAPVLIRLSERQGFETCARVLSYIGYGWMGFLFVAVSYGIAFDAYRLVIQLGARLLHADPGVLIPGTRLVWSSCLLISMLTSAYGYFEARSIRTETVTIHTSKLPEGAERLRIVQISDVHVGLLVREDRLRGILGAVAKANPDILVSTGDLVDGQINQLDGLSDLFHQIRPRYGKFAITGNHEFYAGLDQALAFTRKAGFHLLRGEAVSVEGLITIAGVDDQAGRAYGISSGGDELALLAPLPKDRFVLFLKHRPHVNPDSAGHFDLQLSGHVHRGQIFPFTLMTWLYYPVQSGFARLHNEASLYVSRGSGTWGPPIRFLSPPEVTVIDLVRS